MSDLISMDQLVTELEIEIGETYNDVIIKGIRRAIEIVEQRPTVEAKPIVRGEWIPEEKMVRTPFASNYRCSICGQKNYYALTKFCPNCGADMRGEKND